MLSVDKCEQAGTFVVHIGHCENATWQGDVVWAEENRKKHFRSALELIRLIDDALCRDQGERTDMESAAEGEQNE